MFLFSKTVLALCGVWPALVHAADFGTVTTNSFGSNSTVIKATVNNTPINLFDATLINDLLEFLLSLETIVPAPKVVVIASSLPNYWVTHLDLHLLSANHPPPPPQNATSILNDYFEILNLLSTLPQVFIGEVNGNAYSGGNELLMHMDMRFAGPRASIGAAEVAVGVPHVGGLQQLTKLIGTGRASEWLLSANPITGSKAAEIGWFNEAYDTASELTANVNALAERIALWPYTGLNSTKAGIRENAPSADVIQADVDRFQELVKLDSVQDAIDRIFAVQDVETAGSFEADLLENLPQIWE